MKQKIIQVLLGTIGSLLTIAIQHFTTGSADPAVTVAGAAGINAAFGTVVQNLAA